MTNPVNVLSRTGNRNWNELRPVRLTRGVLKHPAGSALIEWGDNRILCAATVEEKVPPFLMGAAPARGWVTAEYALLPGSTSTRTQRERTRLSGRTYEIQRLIGRSLRTVTDLVALGPRTITVDCDVLQADGGTRTAAITGSYVALCDACLRLVSLGTLPALPIREEVAAVSLGLVGGHLLLDLDYQEDSQADVDMNLVITGSGRFVEIQGTAEKQAFSQDDLQRMCDLALEGVKTLFGIQRDNLSAP